MVPLLRKIIKLHCFCDTYRVGQFIARPALSHISVTALPLCGRSVGSTALRPQINRTSFTILHVITLNIQNKICVLKHIKQLKLPDISIFQRSGGCNTATPPHF